MKKSAKAHSEGIYWWGPASPFHPAPPSEPLQAAIWTFNRHQRESYGRPVRRTEAVETCWFRSAAGGTHSQMHLPASVGSGASC